jgi:hypothetical protein
MLTFPIHMCVSPQPECRANLNGCSFIIHIYHPKITTDARFYPPEVEQKEDEDEDEEEERIMSIGGYILEKKNVILPCSNKNPPPLPFPLCSC